MILKDVKKIIAVTEKTKMQLKRFVFQKLTCTTIGIVKEFPVPDLLMTN
jgi:hypothetical protein